VKQSGQAALYNETEEKGKEKAKKWGRDNGELLINGYKSNKIINPRNLLHNIVLGNYLQ
jgi:hypothetical protein